MVADIARARQSLHQINQLLSKQVCKDDGLVGGTIGLALYYYHCGRVLDEDSLTDRGETLLNGVFEVLNAGGQGLRGPWLSIGGAGFAYVVNYLRQHEFIDIDAEDELTILDDVLFHSAVDEYRRDNIDFLHGAMGIQHYFASREQTADINSYVNRLVEHALEKPVRTDHGIWVRNFGMESHGNTEINFGLSHGLSGYLLTLIEALPHLRRKRRAINTIRQGIDFIMKHQFPVDYSANECSFFPLRFNETDTEFHRQNRLGWCYGDLNELLLLYRAGRALDDNRYIQVADNMGVQVVTRRSYDATLSEDSHFCHGSSGLAQFYKCLFRETGNWIYSEAYHHWMDVTLELVAGELANDPYAVNDTSLLQGWTGVALVIADHLAPEGPNWAGSLLL